MKEKKRVKADKRVLREQKRMPIVELSSSVKEEAKKKKSSQGRRKRIKKYILYTIYIAER